MQQRVIKHIGIADTNEILERLVKLATKIKDMLLENSGLNQFEHAIY